MSVNLAQVLLFAQVGFMFASLPISLLAAYGFRGTPWGRVLALLPPMELAFAVGSGLLLAEVSGVWLQLQIAVYGVAVVCTTLLAFRLTRIIRGGVRA